MLLEVAVVVEFVELGVAGFLERDFLSLLFVVFLLLLFLYFFRPLLV